MKVVRSIASVAAGFLATFAVMMLAVWTIPKLAGPFVYNDPNPSILAYSLLLAAETLSVTVGAYVAALLSTSNEKLHALIVGSIVFALTLWTALQRFGLHPSWYLGGGLLLTLPGAWAGGEVVARWRRKRDEKTA